MMRTMQTHLFQYHSRTVILLASVAIAMSLLACGGGDDLPSPIAQGRVLHFTGRDETEANFRQNTRELKLKETVTWFAACNLLKGQTVQAAKDYLTSDDKDDDPLPKGAVRKPGQKAVEADLMRATEIVLEECKQ
jgi:hypothetical protein